MISPSNFANPRWTPDDIFQLELLAGDYPIDLVLEHFNTWALNNNRPTRTRRSIVAIAHKRNIPLTLHGYGTFITLGQVAAILGINHRKGIYTNFRLWHSRGWLRLYHVSGCTHVMRSDINKLAKRKPALFRSFPHQSLVQLFGCSDLADLVMQQPPQPKPNGQPRPVINLTTGTLYPSIKAAARSSFISSNVIHYAIKDPRRTGAGYRWAYADLDSRQP